MEKEVTIKVIAFNHANIKRLNANRTMLRKMSNSEFASQAFRAIVIERIKDKPRGRGTMFSRRKRRCDNG